MFSFFRKIVSSKLSDEELIRIYGKKRDSLLAEEVFSRYTHLIFGVCFKYLKDEEKSKDAVMQIIEKILIDPPKQEMKSFKNWLFTVTKNHCLMAIRHEQAETRAVQQRFLELKDEVMEIPKPEHQSEQKEKEEILSELRMAVAKLGKEQKMCIELFYIDGKSYAEIAELTGFNMNAVKSHIQNGKRNLKNILGHD
jgi:RNA polymerase sigma factor (sigma-70 family)